jgi:hypothetical protein
MAGESVLMGRAIYYILIHNQYIIININHWCANWNLVNKNSKLNYRMVIKLLALIYCLLYFILNLGSSHYITYLLTCYIV